MLAVTGGTPGTPGVDATGGWSFTPTQAVSVTALDAFDPTGDGTAGAVRLYTAGGTVLASAQVTTSDSQEGSPTKFYSAPLATPVSLLANATYYIAEDFGTATMAFAGTGTTFATEAVIEYGSEVHAMSQGQKPTTDVAGGMFHPGIFGPNFDIAGVGTPVPEPGSFALLGIGVLVLLVAGLTGRRKLPG
ncbi:MAG: DUF4082 domain-containing protein [Alphaproteobacteria bacterium]|nr:DUF4082 domain-containing protein [Alphaproteobacteria bacterium]